MDRVPGVHSQYAHWLFSFHPSNVALNPIFTYEENPSLLMKREEERKNWED